MTTFSFTLSYGGARHWIAGDVTRQPKHCTYPTDSAMCHRPATGMVRGEGRLRWYRCKEHEGLRANGERGEVLDREELWTARSDLFPDYQASSDTVTGATLAFREGLKGWLAHNPDQIPKRTRI